MTVWSFFDASGIKEGSKDYMEVADGRWGADHRAVNKIMRVVVLPPLKVGAQINVFSKEVTCLGTDAPL